VPWRTCGNLGVAAPDPIRGPRSISGFLVEKVRELRASNARFRKSSFGAVPLLLAYRGEQLINALAFVFRMGRVRTIYLINCPVRLRSIAAQGMDSQSGELLN